MAKDGGVFSRLRRLESVDDVAAGYGDTDEVHVLAVDDSLVDRKVIERLLRITSCKVTAVDSGMRALQFLGLLGEEESSVGFDDLKVDLVITDYCMPGMTGYELLKKIKGSSTFREIPVVIMSSENILARIDRCLQEGAEDFIVKPVKLSDVKRLKTCMFGEGRVKTEDGSERFASKRKLQDNGLNVDNVNALQSESCPDDETSSILSPPPSMSCSSGSGSSSSSPSRPSSPIPQDPISHDVIQADQKQEQEQEDQGQR